MINYTLAKQIHMQRIQLQQEKETYENCFNEYKSEMENEYYEFSGRLQAFAYHDDEIHETKDIKLLNLIEYNRESLSKAEEMCGELLMTIDKEFKSYLFEYGVKDDALQREQQRLELMI